MVKYMSSIPWVAFIQYVKKKMDNLENWRISISFELDSNASNSDLILYFICRPTLTVIIYTGFSFINYTLLYDVILMIDGVKIIQNTDVYNHLKEKCCMCVTPFERVELKKKETFQK